MRVPPTRVHFPARSDVVWADAVGFEKSTAAAATQKHAGHEADEKNDDQHQPGRRLDGDPQ